MNAKKAKELRRQVQLQTIGNPLVEYEPRAYKEGKEVPRRLTQDCTRGVYKRLKKTA